MTGAGGAGHVVCVGPRRAEPADLHPGGGAKAALGARGGRGARRSPVPNEARSPAPRQPCRMEPPRRLAPPRLRRGIVARPRLSRALDSGWEASLTLVVAPAGYGKTVAVELWLAERGHAAAWVRADARDDDADPAVVVCRHGGRAGAPGRRRRRARGAARPRRRGAAGDRGARDRARADERPIVLVVDDVQSIGDARCLRSLDHAVASLPEHVQLVLISRTVPRAAAGAAAHAGRARRGRRRRAGVHGGRGAATVRGGARRLGGRGDRRSADRGARRDGPRCSIWLRCGCASVATRRRRCARSAARSATSPGTSPAKCWASCDPDARQFLQRTAVLPQLCGELCDAVLQQSGSRDRLRALERANLLVIPLVDRPGWYRYHALLRDHLLGEVDRADAAAVRRRALQLVTRPRARRGRRRVRPRGRRRRCAARADRGPCARAGSHRSQSHDRALDDGHSARGAPRTPAGAGRRHRRGTRQRAAGGGDPAHARARPRGRSCTSSAPMRARCSRSPGRCTPTTTWARRCVRHRPRSRSREPTRSCWSPRSASSPSSASSRATKRRPPRTPARRSSILTPRGEPYGHIAAAAALAIIDARAGRRHSARGHADRALKEARRVGLQGLPAAAPPLLADAVTAALEGRLSGAHRAARQAVAAAIAGGVWQAWALLELARIELRRGRRLVGRGHAGTRRGAARRGPRRGRAARARRRAAGRARRAGAARQSARPSRCRRPSWRSCGCCHTGPCARSRRRSTSPPTRSSHTSARSTASSASTRARTRSRARVALGLLDEATSATTGQLE